MNILLDPDARPVVAHRGGCARGPENTLEAMQLGVAEGADAIEFDVHLCADGKVVVIHDATVDRTTDGSGAVDQMSLANLRSLDAACRFTGVQPSPPISRPCRIPTLGEVLESFPRIPLIIEVKTRAASVQTRALIEQHGAEDRCLVDSVHADALAVFRGSRIARGPSRNGVARLIIKSFLHGASRNLEPSALCIPRSYRGFPLPIKRLSALMRSAGKTVHVWTVNDRREAIELWGLGVSGIITDDVPAIRSARAEMSGKKLG
ncbi:MAG: glycerophosphodiester phosphodiesterase family protein [Gemmatimonadaceae bacterium]